MLHTFHLKSLLHLQRCKLHLLSLLAIQLMDIHTFKIKLKYFKITYNMMRWINFGFNIVKRITIVTAWTNILLSSFLHHLKTIIHLKQIIKTYFNICKSIFFAPSTHIFSKFIFQSIRRFWTLFILNITSLELLIFLINISTSFLI